MYQHVGDPGTERKRYENADLGIWQCNSYKYETFINLGGRDHQQIFSNSFSSAGSKVFLYNNQKHKIIFN